MASVEEKFVPSARSAGLQWPQAKRQCRNWAPEKKPEKIEMQWSAQEKSAEPPAISSAHAGKRFRLPCSDGHKGSTMQK